MTSAYNNQQLFSDHYLGETLPRREDWQALLGEAAAMLPRIAEIFTRYQRGGRKEAQTEYRLVRPILEVLGHTFEVQPSLKTSEGPKTPDYIFYRDQLAKLRKLWISLPPPEGNRAAKQKADEARKALGYWASQSLTLEDAPGKLDSDQWRWLLRERLPDLSYERRKSAAQAFDEQQPLLASLELRIRAIEELIDKIVYCLYGLTENEIAIVEGRLADASPRPYGNLATGGASPRPYGNLATGGASPRPYLEYFPLVALFNR